TQSFANIAGTTLTNVAGGLANAGARSLINGTDFGDNILAALPDAIANTIGNLVADQVAGGGKPKAGGTGTGQSGNSIAASDGTQGSGSGADSADAEFGDIVVTARRPS